MKISEIKHCKSCKKETYHVNIAERGESENMQCRECKQEKTARVLESINC